MAEIVIIGTSHISRQSVAEIKQAIETHHPQCVAVELDMKRLHALLSKQKPSISFGDMFRIGIKGFMFALIGSYVQKKLGKLVGTAPGSDMLEAVKLAKKNMMKIALIDQDIEITLRRFSNTLSWRERFRFVWDIIKGAVMPKAELRRYGLDKIDLTRVPPEQLIKKMTLQLKKRYPNVYNVLIRERNQHMIKQLKQLSEQYPVIVAVVGAGHKEAIEKAVSARS